MRIIYGHAKIIIRNKKPFSAFVSAAPSRKRYQAPAYRNAGQTKVPPPARAPGHYAGWRLHDYPPQQLRKLVFDARKLLNLRQ